MPSAPIDTWSQRRDELGGLDPGQVGGADQSGVHGTAFGKEKCQVIGQAYVDVVRAGPLPVSRFVSLPSRCEASIKLAIS